jgi:hypothetical protein
MPDTINEGTVMFWIRADPDRPQVFTDLLPARFPTFHQAGVKIDVAKNPNGTALVTVDGPHARTYRLFACIPPCDDQGLFVVVTWSTSEVAVFFNGQPVQKVPA